MSSKIRTSIRQDTLYMLKDIFKDSISELQNLDYSRDVSEILQDVMLIQVKSCNTILDKIEGRGYK